MTPIACLTLGCSLNDPRHPDKTESVPRMERYKYQCWEGGPHLLLPDYLRGAWRGHDTGLRPLDPATDYGRACAVAGEFGLIPVGVGHALVLGQDPPMVAWSPHSPPRVEDIFVLKSWEHTDLDALLDAALGKAAFQETGLIWDVRESGGSIYYAGDDPIHPIAGRIAVPLLAGTYKILRSEYTDVTMGSLVVIRLELQSR
jgi:hypothetical protein